MSGARLHSLWGRRSRLVYTLWLMLSLSSHSQPLNASSVAVAESSVSLSLHQAEISDLVHWAAAVTDKTIVIHPAVSGQVTVIAGEPMPREQAYELFLSVLSLHGFAVSEADNVLTVIPAQLGREQPTALDRAPRGRSDLVVRLFTLSQTEPRELMELLRPMLPQDGYIAAYPHRSALLVAARAAKVEQLAQLIERLDQPLDTGIEWLPINFASAGEVAATLDKVMQAGDSGQRGGSTLRIAVDERTNSLLIAGSSAEKQQLRALVGHLDQPLPSDGNTQVIFLQFARASELVPILDSVANSLSQAARGQEGRSAADSVSIRADPALNSVIITASSAAMATLKGLIAKLDVRRAQVLVEALIVEVNEDFSRDLGIEWRTHLDRSGSATFAGFNAFPGAVPPFSDSGDAPITLGRGLSLGFFRGSDLRSIIRALEGNADANVLSTPTILAMDNEQASILVGSNVPFVVGSQKRPGDADPFQTIERQDIGVTLKLKPHINNSDSVTLEIEQTVESIARTDAATADIVTNKREISTRVLIDDDQVLVLGGLIKDEVVVSVSKVPLLGSLPLIGRAFRSSSNKVVKQNLMVFIHPTILRDQSAAQTVTRDRYRSMRQQQLVFSSRIDGELLPGTLPQLPPRDFGDRQPPAAEQGQ